LLKNSRDPAVAGAFAHKAARERSFTRTWSASRELESLSPLVEHEIRFAGQQNREGLGVGRYLAQPSLIDRRSLLTKTLLVESEKLLVEHSSTLVRQGVWTHWSAVRPFDLSWNNLIYGPGPKLLSFVLNSLINSVRTPDMLQLWGYKTTAECPLCGIPKCTLHHELVGCKVALDQGRYSWRHDSVLSNIQTALELLIGRVKVRPSAFLKHSFPSSFVRAGVRSRTSAKHPPNSLLDGASDWRLSVDYKHNQAVFPPVIYATSERPDVVIWSESSRRVLLLELTCPAEEGIEAARERKNSKYLQLLDGIRRHWSADLYTIEIGARGLVPHWTFKIFRLLGLTACEANNLCRALSLVSSRCSFAIHCAHTDNAWIPRGLIRAPPPPPPLVHTWHRHRQRPSFLPYSSSSSTVPYSSSSSTSPYSSSSTSRSSASSSTFTSSSHFSRPFAHHLSSPSPLSRASSSSSSSSSSSASCSLSHSLSSSPSLFTTSPLSLNESNLHLLFRSGVIKLYHFTDRSCLESLAYSRGLVLKGITF
jgi:hypothetical protein